MEAFGAHTAVSIAPHDDEALAEVPRQAQQVHAVITPAVADRGEAPASAATFDLDALFGEALATPASKPVFLQGRGFSRTVQTNRVEWLVDRFEDRGVACAAVRLAAGESRRLRLAVKGSYALRSTAAGGWLLTPLVPERDAFWIPQPPILRTLDDDGHILSHRVAVLAGLDVSNDALMALIEQPAGHVLDIVIWRLPAHEPDLQHSLSDLSPLERQPYFLWSSHTVYTRPADLYLHWVHGHVYENHEVWPKYWRVCSELDAYAVYVLLTGLLRSTGKRLYDLLRSQVVFSVIARQAADGGWHHGEWTDEMESHYRLHAAGMHLLAANYEETHDPTVGAALAKAAMFTASTIDRLNLGVWYLHDSLERGPGALRAYPFRTLPSRVLGKSEGNLLVLNTHLDSNIAMARYAQVTGDRQYDDLVASARKTTLAVLALRPAKWLYRALFRAIELTFLSTDKASALPALSRGIKRIAWKYLIRWLPHIKRRWPRLVMPGGYVERELTMCAFSVRYQPVNLMDLIRTRRLFDETVLDPLVDDAFPYTHDCGLIQRWKERKGKEDDSLGFWAEALYHLCLANPDERYRAWLAEAILDLEDNRLGVPPSLLGSNAEAVSPSRQQPCPSPGDARLRVANLSQGDRIEWLVVNPTPEAIAFRWSRPPAADVAWHSSLSDTDNESGAPVIQARSWALARGSQPTHT